MQAVVNMNRLSLLEDRSLLSRQALEEIKFTRSTLDRVTPASYRPYLVLQNCNKIVFGMVDVDMNDFLVMSIAWAYLEGGRGGRAPPPPIAQEILLCLSTGSLI